MSQNTKSDAKQDILRVGIGGPVGAGKTTLVEALCRHLRRRFDIGVVTNDIYTQEDMETVSYTHLTLPTICSV